MKKLLKNSLPAFIALITLEMNSCSKEDVKDVFIRSEERRVGKEC